MQKNGLFFTHSVRLSDMLISQTLNIILPISTLICLLNTVMCCLAAMIRGVKQDVLHFRHCVNIILYSYCSKATVYETHLDLLVSVELLLLYLGAMMHQTPIYFQKKITLQDHIHTCGLTMSEWTLCSVWLCKATNVATRYR